MAEINLIIRTADKARKAEISVSSEQTGVDIINAAVENWKLPTDTEYSLVNVTKGSSIIPSNSLQKSGVESNDILEVQPVLAAGVL